MGRYDAEQMAEGFRKFMEQVENHGGALAKKWFETDEFVRAAHWNTTSSAHLQKLFSEQMARCLTGLNMPNRDDVTALGERLMAIEERLSQIESLLFALAPKDAAPARPAGPARTRKPPIRDARGGAEAGAAAASKRKSAAKAATGMRSRTSGRARSKEADSAPEAAVASSAASTRKPAAKRNARAAAAAKKIREA